jgi:hypothetical protein
MRANAFGGPLVTHPHNRKDNPMNDSTTKLDGDLDEQGRAMAAADEAAAMPGPSTTGYYDKAAEASPLPDDAAAMSADQAPVFGPRPPVTENQASMRYGPGTHDAIERYSALSLRHALADAEASLKARGEWDEVKFGKGGEQPLTTDEHLELLATAEYLHRSYQPTGGQMDRALDAGADWLAVAQAVGTTEADARGQYRKWAEGQHDMWAGTGVWAGDPSWAPHRHGLSDADYAAAIARAGTEPVSRTDSEPEMVIVPRDDLRMAVSALRDLSAHAAEPLGELAERLAEIEAGQ